MANYATLKAAVADVVKTNGAQAITGANLQTVLLSIINSIGGGGYIFKGVATPSTNTGTPDENVFYIGGAGTYANFGTSVVVPPTNIAVFKYNGAWTCEQVTVENGGVFDISAFNSVGGTLATYSDLATALGTNGANIPVGVRKGGMSIKFVQSSDNKYVQFRYLSTSTAVADFTNVVNWQGIPTDVSLGRPALRNGSLGNTENPNVVTTEVFPTYGKPYIEININRPNVSGYKYTISAISTDSAEDLGKLVMASQLVGPYRSINNRLSTFILDLTLTSYPNTKGVMIQINEVSISDESIYNTLRVGSFDSNDIIIKSNDNFVDYLKHEIDNIDSKPIPGSTKSVSSGGVAESLGYPQLRNGSMGNSANPNVVTTQVFPTFGSKYIGIRIARKNTSGYKYILGATSTDAKEDIGKLVMKAELVGPIHAPSLLFDYIFDIASLTSTEGIMIQISEVLISDESQQNSLRITDFNSEDIEIIGSDCYFDYFKYRIDNLPRPYYIDALSKLSFTGQGSTFVNSVNTIKAINTHIYRIYLQQSVDMTGVSSGRRLEIKVNGVIYFYCGFGQDIPAYFDIEIPSSGENYISIGGRCADGIIYTAYIQDLSNSIVNSEILNVKNVIEVTDWENGKRIENDLTVNPNVSTWKKSKPIQLLKGQKIIINTSDTTGARWKLFETDANESYYIPIIGTNKSGYGKVVMLNYEAIADMYVVCQTTDTYDYEGENIFMIKGSARIVSYWNDFNVVEANEPSKTLQRFLQYSRTVKGGALENVRKNLVLAHFSDIHFDADNLEHIMKFCQYYKNYIDDIINTGDNVANSFNQTSEADYQTFIGNNLAKDVLFCIGNHDTAKYENNAYDWTYYAGAQAYTRYIAPYITNWNVTHDGNTSHCYYYKDYSNEKVRLIVIDVMGWDNDELSWLQSTLASAITNDLQVIIASHYPANMSAQECTFTSLFTPAFGPSSVINDDALSAVDTFITNGGVFIAWLTGHVHRDYIGTITDHPNQLVIAISTASGTNGQSQFDNVQRTKGTKSYDLFNIISIDTYNQRISMFRVGADLDMYQRHIGAICYDYANKRMIYND